MKTGAKYLRTGQHVWVDDELRSGIECTVQGRNSDGHPILEALDGSLRFRGSDRHVLDFPWEKVQTKKPEPTTLEAAKAVLDAVFAGDKADVDAFRRLIPCDNSILYSLLQLRDAVEREERNAPPDQSLTF